MRKLSFRLYRGRGALVHWGGRKLTPAGQLALAALVLSGVFGVDTTQSTAYRIFAFLVALLVLAWLGARFGRHGEYLVTRTLPQLISAGDRFEYRLTIANRGDRQARSLTLIDDLDDPRPDFAQFRHALRIPTWRGWQRLVTGNRIGKVPAMPVPSIAPGEAVELRMQGEALRRGRMHFTGVTVGCDETLGLARSLFTLPLAENLTVLPRRYRLPPISLPGGRRLQQGGVSLASSVGDSEEFIGLREYRPGDPLQRVHWKSFARTGQPVVREYQDEFFERHALVLDTFAAPGQVPAFEEAVAVAASFACTIDTQECLLDLMFVADHAHVYTAGRGQLGSDSLLEVLAGVGVEAGRPFSALAEAMGARAAGLTGCICILLGWDRERSDLVDAMRSRGSALRVLCVASDAPADLPPWVLHLTPGRIQEGLARL
jgi:uncharacterized protein (DUF58 family)